MKRILSLVVFISVMVSAVCAQHIMFSGLPLTGNITEFSRLLRDRGFQLQKRMPGDNYYIYKGMYAGHSSYFQVSYSSKSNTVYQVRVTPKHVNTLVYRDSLASIYGLEYETTDQGYRWVREDGMVMLAVPEDKDPVLIILDLDGARLSKKEQK